MKRTTITLSCVLLWMSVIACAQDTRLTYFGMHMHRVDAGSPWPPFAFGAWRLWDAYVAWPQLQPERDRWHFGRLDRYVELATANRVEIVLTLGLTPAWASARPTETSGYRPGNAAEPLMPGDWRRYVQTVAERYKGRIRHYEIWNEPSDKKFFTGTPELLAELIRDASIILKRVDPANQVVSPGNAGGGRHLTYLDQLLSKGVKEHIDIVGYHFYAPNDYPEAMVPLIRAVKQIMAKHDIANKPLWNTETGWWIENRDGTPDHPMVASGGWRKLDSRTEAGAFLSRSLIIGRAEGIERFFWYSWDNLYGLGMREPKSGETKAMAAFYERTVKSLVGMKIESCNVSGGVWFCILKSSNNHKTEWLVWSEEGTREWSIPKDVMATRVQPLSKDKVSSIESRSMLVGAVPMRLSH